MNETFCLRFNEFDGFIKSSWLEHQRDNDFCDITLACEDRQIKTHKFVISAFSPVLRNILKLHQNPHPLIYLRKVKFVNLQNLITFMYQGEVDVVEEDFPSFLEAAKDLNIRGLSKANTESFNSSGEFPSEPSLQDISPPLKRKGIAESQKKVKAEEITQNDDESISQNVVSTIAEKQFHCQKCNKNFSDKNNLNKHNKSSHEGVKYHCTKCTYMATQKGTLQKHEAAVHEGIKYPCTKCNYKASFKQHLKSHVAAVHEGIKYPCTECNYKASFKKHIKSHVAAVHEGIKYPCTKCNYKAGFKQALKSHVMSCHVMKVKSIYALNVSIRQQQ